MQGECHLTNQDGHGKVVLIAIQIDKLYELQFKIDIPSSHTKMLVR
jgi:hypothetical protein